MEGILFGYRRSKRGRESWSSSQILPVGEVWKQKGVEYVLEDLEKHSTPAALASIPRSASFAAPSDSRYDSGTPGHDGLSSGLPSEAECA